MKRVKAMLGGKLACEVWILRKLGIRWLFGSHLLVMMRKEEVVVVALLFVIPWKINQKIFGGGYSIYVRVVNKFGGYYIELFFSSS